jgi:hypothetical protein
MANPPKFTGFGGYGPWPDNDRPNDTQPGGGHYEDGYHDRAPGGTRIENPSDYWIDCVIYPDRQAPTSDAEADRQYLRARDFRISAGNATGLKPGPSDED